MQNSQGKPIKPGLLNLKARGAGPGVIAVREVEQMLEAKPVNDIANIDKIDIQKTFEKILYVPKYCYSLLKAIEEELAGKPLPEIPKDGMAYMMWHTEGLVAYTSIPF